MLPNVTGTSGFTELSIYIGGSAKLSEINQNFLWYLRARVKYRMSQKKLWLMENGHWSALGRARVKKISIHWGEKLLYFVKYTWDIVAQRWLLSLKNMTNFVGTLSLFWQNRWDTSSRYYLIVMKNFHIWKNWKILTILDAEQ